MKSTRHPVPSEQGGHRLHARRGRFQAFAVSESYRSREALVPFGGAAVRTAWVFEWVFWLRVTELRRHRNPADIRGPCVIYPRCRAPHGLNR